MSYSHCFLPPINFSKYIGYNKAEHPDLAQEDVGFLTNELEKVSAIMFSVNMSQSLRSYLHDFQDHLFQRIFASIASVSSNFTISTCKSHFKVC